MPKTAAATPTAVHWRAPGEDGEAHAFSSRLATPAACGLPWTHPRWDWARRSKCATCLDVLARDDLDPPPPRMPRR